MQPPAGYNAAQKTFADTFSGASLNTNNWVTFYGAQGARWDDYGLWPSPYSSDNDPAHGGNGYQVAVHGPEQISINNGCALAAVTPIPASVHQHNPDPSFFTWFSGCLNTQGKFQLSATGWYVQVKAKRPDVSAGAWPSIWFMPDTSSSPAVEYDGDEGGMTAYGPVNQVVHSNYFATNGAISAGYNTGVDLSQDYHTYGFEFLPPVGTFKGSVKSYIDGHNYFSALGSSGVAITAGTYELMIQFEICGPNGAGWHTVPGAVTSYTWNIAEVQIYSPG